MSLARFRVGSTVTWPAGAVTEFADLFGRKAAIITDAPGWALSLMTKGISKACSTKALFSVGLVRDSGT
jgi:hypothetical protein